MVPLKKKGLWPGGECGHRRRGVGARKGLICGRGEGEGICCWEGIYNSEERYGSLASEGKGGWEKDLLGGGKLRTTWGGVVGVLKIEKDY